MVGRRFHDNGYRRCLVIRAGGSVGSDAWKPTGERCACHRRFFLRPNPSSPPPVTTSGQFILRLPSEAATYPPVVILEEETDGRQAEGGKINVASSVKDAPDCVRGICNHSCKRPVDEIQRGRRSCQFSP